LQQLRASGTMKGHSMGAPPPGRRAIRTESNICRFANGKLEEHWAYFNQVDLMQHLGLAPGH